MNTKSLQWYRNNSDFTEQKGLVYFDMVNHGAGTRYKDKVLAPSGLKFFGTPGEYSAKFNGSKYISLATAPSRGKVFYVNYDKNPRLTKKEVFPGSGNNDRLNTDASPYHMVKLWCGSSKTSLSLNNHTKIWS
tara:strand:+ start:1937 stop:2335 length:399 start_codon:yes stop_codon:yes gene_type:complete